MLECIDVLNRQLNLFFTIVPNEFQPSADLRMKALREILRAVFRTIGIPNPFPHFKGISALESSWAHDFGSNFCFHHSGTTKRANALQINISGARSHEAGYIEMLCTNAYSLHNNIQELHERANTALLYVIAITEMWGTLSLVMLRYLSLVTGFSERTVMIALLGEESQRL